MTHKEESNETQAEAWAEQFSARGWGVKGGLRGKFSTLAKKKPKVEKPTGRRSVRISREELESQLFTAGFSPVEPAIEPAKSSEPPEKLDFGSQVWYKGSVGEVSTPQDSCSEPESTIPNQENTMSADLNARLSEMERNLAKLIGLAETQQAETKANADAAKKAAEEAKASAEEAKKAAAEAKAAASGQPIPPAAPKGLWSWVKADPLKVAAVAGAGAAVGAGGMYYYASRGDKTTASDMSM